jgi:hypothetical protein
MEFTPATKVCKLCKVEKPLDTFGRNSRLKDGLFHNCKDCVNSKNKRLRDANPELYKAHKRKWNNNNNNKRYEWIKNNPEKRRAIMRKNKNRRYREEPLYKLKQNIRNRLAGLFKKTPSTKSLTLLGCSVEEYKQYLEKLFQPGMSWENYKHDGWHIDHIKPIASFDLTKEDQIKAAFHYTNTQPLWAKDNIQKKDKLNWSKNA